MGAGRKKDPKLHQEEDLCPPKNQPLKTLKYLSDLADICEQAQEPKKGRTPTKYARFPRIDNSEKLDKAFIREDYFKSPHLKWTDYCSSKNYNDNNYNLPYHKWELMKKERVHWEAIRDDAHSRFSRLEPDAMLNIIKTLDSIPQVMLRMWDILSYHVSVDQNAIAHDINLRRQAQASGNQIEKKDLSYKGNNTNLWMLSQAAKNIQESLYKSLGISQVNAELLGDLRSKLDQKLSANHSEEEIEAFTAEPIGASSIKEALSIAVTEYYDAPHNRKNKPDGDNQDMEDSPDDDAIDIEPNPEHYATRGKVIDSSAF